MQTLFERIWHTHRVCALDDSAELLLIDRIVMHERTGSIALTSLADAGRTVRSPGHAFCVMDHIVDTRPGRGDASPVPSGAEFITATRNAARAAGLRLFDINDPMQGISHLVSAEQGIALPGLTLVCPDSHTCTLGALGTLAFGIGSSECEHALATDTLRLQRPKQMRVRVDGRLGPGVTAKDLVLHLIGRYGAGGAQRHAVEFAGSAISALDMEARFTLCNMAVEFSAFTGLIAPDAKTIDYLRGRALAPAGADFDAAAETWLALRSDEGAAFDRELIINASDVSTAITWGTSPQHCVPISGVVPDPSAAGSAEERQAMERALAYMGLTPGTALTTLPINAAFIGSCTNARLSDLRAAAEVLRGRHVAEGVTAICIPGSKEVKRHAEAEGLDRVFTDAGFQWREPGCGFCFYAGGEGFPEGARVVSSTNRNFEGRQGRGARTHLASPATVAACAVAGRISDPGRL